MRFPAPQFCVMCVKKVAEMNHKEHLKISPDNLNSYGQIIDEATKEYYAWLKQILTLASGSLTVLIALRNQILPEHPQYLILLQISWILFALAIVLALFALRGHHILLFHTAQDFRQAATSQSSDTVAGMTKAPDIYTRFGQIVPLVFVSAVVALSLFGILNLSQGAKTKLETQKTRATISAPQSKK